MTLQKRQTRRPSGEAGAELIEFALALPLLLVVSLAIVDFGFLFQRGEVLTNSAREGARIAVQTGTTQTEIENRVVSYVQMAGSLPVTAGNPAVTVTTGSVSTPGGTWPTRTVSVSYDHDYLFLPYVLGLIGGGGLNQTTLQAQSTMRFLAPSAAP